MRVASISRPDIKGHHDCRLYIPRDVDFEDGLTIPASVVLVAVVRLWPLMATISASAAIQFRLDG